MTLIELCNQAYAATRNWERQDSRMRWVMDRPSYDRLRAEAINEDQESARARQHANILVRADAQPPHRCPACPAGPFATMRELSEHVAAMADPSNREPAEGDQLFGIAIVVREGGGEPHLEQL